MNVVSMAEFIQSRTRVTTERFDCDANVLVVTRQFSLRGNVECVSWFVDALSPQNRPRDKGH